MPDPWKLIPLLFVSLALVACGSLTPPVTKATDTRYYTVKKGDTLYGIAFGLGNDYREVAAWNKIRPPYRIYPGQTLAIIPPHNYRASSAVEDSPEPVSPPVSATSSAKVSTPPSVPVSQPASGIKKPASTKHARTTKPLEKPLKKRQGKIDWRWPTTGKIITAYDFAKSEKGIDVSGAIGQAIKASAAGDVVYSGKGLIGYGNLIIIKHDELYLSAYGHNRRLLVKEGDKVEGGQQIAEMGKTSKDGPILHFEIRKNGKPVDPMRYLP